jgi:metal-responsive CopG/Arc/MetJ family transcriptional regulator
MGAKAKVSVTVDRELLREVDRLAGRASRSRVFEDALAEWVRRRGQAELDRAIERYYRAQNVAERAEDETWASAADDTVRTRWDR